MVGFECVSKMDPVNEDRRRTIMPLVEAFRNKKLIDRLSREVEARFQLPAGQRKLNKDAVRRLLGLSGFEPARVRDLELFVRPLEGETKEVVVLDNELPIYHTTISDVGLRKTPYVREMISVRNIRKILNDKDVVVSKAGDSLRRIYAQAFVRLDFSYSEEEIKSLIEEGKQGLRRNSVDRVEEPLEVFLELLGYQEVDLGVLEGTIRAYAILRSSHTASPTYRDLLLIDWAVPSLRLIKGEFSIGLDSDHERLLTSLRENRVDAEDGEVFDYLGGLALRVDPAVRRNSIRGMYPVEDRVLEEEIV
jgi:hypothetical protein